MHPSPVSVSPDASVQAQRADLFPLQCPIVLQPLYMCVCEGMSAGCCRAVLTQLQPDIPAFPIQTLSGFYCPVPVLLFLSICTLTKNS